MGILIVMCGAPASGKSTVADNIAEEYAMTIICPDDIRAEIFGDAADQRDGWRVFQLAYDRMCECLDAGESVVFDATNCRRRARRDILAEADGLYDVSICAVSSVDLDTCLSRNASRSRQVPEDVIEKMFNNLNACWPDTDEGFDYVVEISELEDLLEEIIA